MIYRIDPSPAEAKVLSDYFERRQELGKSREHIWNELIRLYGFLEQCNNITACKALREIENAEKIDFYQLYIEYRLEIIKG